MNAKTQSRQRAGHPDGNRRELMGSPSHLVAIARAAHETGDVDLSRIARQELRTRFGIKISFEGDTVSPASAPADREVSNV